MLWAQPPVGNVRLDALTDGLMLTALSGVFVACEVQDWGSTDRQLPADGQLCQRPRGGGRAFGLAGLVSIMVSPDLHCPSST